MNISVFKAGIFKNPYLVLSLISGLILEVSVISVPYLANIFGVVPLNAMGWIVVTVLSIMPLIIVELQKVCQLVCMAKGLIYEFKQFKENESGVISAIRLSGSINAVFPIWE